MCMLMMMLDGSGAAESGAAESGDGEPAAASAQSKRLRLSGLDRQDQDGDDEEACDTPMGAASVQCPVCLEFVPAFCVGLMDELQTHLASVAATLVQQMATLMAAVAVVAVAGALSGWTRKTTGCFACCGGT